MRGSWLVISKFDCREFSVALFVSVQLLLVNTKILINMGSNHRLLKAAI